MKRINLLMLLLLCLVFVGCDSTKDLEVTGDTTAYLNQELTLTANKDVTWSSLDTAIATITEDGVITGVSEGIVEIKAVTANEEETVTTKIKVLDPNPVMPEFLKVILEDDENITEIELDQVMCISMLMNPIVSSIDNRYTYEIEDESIIQLVDLDDRIFATALGIKGIAVGTTI